MQAYLNFYRTAKTKYRIHSPFLFELALATVEDKRHFYAFDEVKHVRSLMLQETTELTMRDFGAGPSGSLDGTTGFTERKARICDIAKRAGSRPRQGKLLFRLIDFLEAKNGLELGSSLGLGTMYMASAMRLHPFIALEGDHESARVAKVNTDILNLNNVEFRVGSFDETLEKALKDLQQVDFVFFDGNHRKEPTLDYFEKCLPYAHENTAFVFDDIFWSQGMLDAWEIIKKHPKVTATVDFLDFSVAFFSPDFKEKIHIGMVPTAWKPYQF